MCNTTNRLSKLVTLLLTVALALSFALPVTADDAAPPAEVTVPTAPSIQVCAISAPATFEVGMGQCPTLPAALVPDDGSFALKFMSSDSSVCKIALSTGVFKPYAEGTCTVTIYAVPTSKSVTAEAPVSVEVAVTVTRDVLLARVVQTGENTMSLLFTGRVKDIDLSLISVVDENGTPLTITSIGVNPNWKDVVDVTVAETFALGKTYSMSLGDRRVSFDAKDASAVALLPKPTPTPRKRTTPITTSIITSIITSATMVPPVPTQSSTAPSPQPSTSSEVSVQPQPSTSSEATVVPVFPEEPAVTD